MSRLAKRLRGYQGSNPFKQDYNQPEDEYEDAEFYGDDESYGLEDSMNQQALEQSVLAQEYDRLQQKAIKYEKELEAVEKTNPHTLYKEVVTDPTPKGIYEMRVFGRPIDLASLEHYVIHKISPKSVTTLMKYNNSKTMEEIKGYSKRPPIRIKGGLIWIILGAVGLLILGIVVLTYGQNMSEVLKGMFGGMY